MRPYTFYLHENGRPTPDFDFVHCGDGAEAVAHARRLLNRFPEYELIEVYDGEHARVAVRRETRPAAVRSPESIGLAS